MRKSKINLDAIDPTKAKLRQDIAEQIKAFLKSGGSIQQCEDGQSANADLRHYRKGQIRGLEKMQEQGNGKTKV